MEIKNRKEDFRQINHMSIYDFSLLQLVYIKNQRLFQKV
jgi:hypothetical protein